MNLSVVGRYDFIAEPFFTDVNRSLSVGMLGTCLLNCAGRHAEMRGFGSRQGGRVDYLWVLSRLAIEIRRMPVEYEPFVVETWIEGIYRTFTNRNFAVLDGDGHPLAYARSVWATIQAESRQPVVLSDVYGEGMADFVCTDRLCPIDKCRRPRASSEQAVETWIPKYGDIDENGHVNSIRYINRLLDVFPLKQYREQQVKRIDIAYHNESFWGESLQIYKDEIAENRTVLEIKHENGETVCSSVVEFIYFQ